MSNLSNRAVQLDDTDPRIQYEGPWESTTNGSTDSFGNFGPPYKKTLHKALSDASISFKFRGSNFGVYGTIDTTNGKRRPSWICNLDGRGLGLQAAPPDQRTNWFVFCEFDVAGLDEHTVTFNATVPDTAELWIDRVSFIPLDDATSGETVTIHEGDPGIVYEPSDNWQDYGVFESTNVSNSFLTYNFSGTALTFYTVQFPDLNESTGQYTIDGGDPIRFFIPSHMGGPAIYNSPLFSVSDLSSEQHTLVTTYTGQNNTAPLVLDYFFVDLLPKTQSPSSSISPTARPSANTTLDPGPSGTQKNAPSSTLVGAIVGGVFGGVFGLLFLAFVICLLLRRKRRSMKPSTPPLVSPFYTQPFSNFFRPELDLYGSTSANDKADDSHAIEKQRLAMAEYSRPSRDIHHVDSGIRYGESSGRRDVLEPEEPRHIPPEYTEH